MNRLLTILLICMLHTLNGFAADSLRLQARILIQGRLMTVDELGQVYVVRTDQSLVRYSEQGDSTGFFRSIQNGPIGSIDATNPLRVLVYYPAYGKVVVLDRMLSPQLELQLARARIDRPAAVAASADGNLWVYDQFQARLLRFNDQLQLLTEGNDLRQQMQLAPQPVLMLERGRRLFMVDTSLGILVFDQFGTLLQTLPERAVASLQVFGDQMLYRRGDTLIAYHLEQFTEKKLPLPGGAVVAAALMRQTLYVLYADRLLLYRMPGSPD